MDSKAILDRLDSGVPLFDALPVITDDSQKRIIGTEIEFGADNRPNPDPKSDPIAEFYRLPIVLRNGGEIYEDLKHVEYASPECSNPLSAAAYYEAGKMKCNKEKFSRAMYCHNTDPYGNTFGSHESYYTRLPRERWNEALPFLIARTLFCGIGWYAKSGQYSISQRAAFIETDMGVDTTMLRPIVNLRDEPLGMVKGWDRLHIICSDATMSEMATFLRIGSMSIFLEMLESGPVPGIVYDGSWSASDVQGISNAGFSGSWHLKGMRKGPKGALELLSLYLERAKDLFSHRDPVNDALFVIWQDTLDKLGRDPMLLVRRLDWVTKFFVLDLFSKKDPRCTPDFLQSEDMQYHNIDPDTGLYYGLRQSGLTERLMGDEAIDGAMREPPLDTRAYVRGKLTQYFEDTRSGLSLRSNNWASIDVFEKRSGESHNIKLLHEIKGEIG